MMVNRLFAHAVVFLLEERSGIRDPVATVFRVELANTHEKYFVTARHCIEGLSSQAWLRINHRSGGYVDIPVSRESWFIHETSDVAILAQGLSPDFDQADIGAISTECFVGSDYRYNGPWQLGRQRMANPFTDRNGWLLQVGEEVYFVGLFVQAAGKRRNLPVARFGAISAMPEEPIILQRDKHTVFEQLAYLVECRSWGGHSGSPAFWLHHGVLVIENKDIPLGWGIPPLGSFQGMFGLVAAHYAIEQGAKVIGDESLKVRIGLNSGIAIVTPAHYILELLMREDVIADREERAREQSKRRPVATMDSGGESR